MGATTSLVLAIFGEVVCSACLIAGLGTRLCAVPYAFTMFVAGVVVHAGDEWDTREKAMPYLVGVRSGRFSGMQDRTRTRPERGRGEPTCG